MLKPNALLPLFAIALSASANAQVAVKRLPGMAALEETVTLRSLPDAMLTLARPAGWAIRRTPSTKPLPGAPASAYVERTAVLIGKGCALPPDSVDLRPIRAHGFRLVAASVDELKPPPGMFPTPQGKDIILRGADGQRLGSNGPAGDAASITISTHSYVKAGIDKRFPNVCANGYRLTLRVRGPSGVDPLTGAPTTRMY